MELLLFAFLAPVAGKAIALALNKGIDKADKDKK